MKDAVSVLAELDGLRGENLLTKALALLIREEIAAGTAGWVTGFFLDEEGSPPLTAVWTEQIVGSAEEKTLGRVDMILKVGIEHTAVEVKLDADFQHLQLERYARSEVARLCVLIPESRISEPPKALDNGRGEMRTVYTRTWQALFQKLQPLNLNQASSSLDDSTLRRAFLRAEIRRYFESYYKLFDEAELQQLQQHLRSIDSSERTARESRLLYGIRRLPALRGMSPRIASAAHYIGFELASDDKDRGPLGWIGFVNTAKYKLELDRDGEVFDRGWRLVLCRTGHCHEASSTQPDDELGLRLVKLAESGSVKGITRHAQADDAIFEVTDLLGKPGSLKLEELWNQRVQAVFGNIALTQTS